MMPKRNHVSFFNYHPAYKSYKDVYVLRKSVKFHILADPAKARGCSTNSPIINQLIQ